MKSLLFVLILSSFSSFAANIGTRGGGDPCEDRIKDIRDDLQKWIKNGGPSGLTLPQNITVNTYSETMLTQIKKTNIICFNKGEKGDTALVNDSLMPCTFDLLKNKSFIKCDRSLFLKLSESNQYINIHHGYAGLAGFEILLSNNSESSVSKQISSFLIDTLVKKLAIHPRTSVIDCTDATLASITEQGNNLITKQDLNPIKEIIALTKSCANDKVKQKAGSVLAVAASAGESNKTYFVAEVLKDYCHDDTLCALNVIELISKGISTKFIQTSTIIIELIVQIAISAPTQTVKNKAISTLSSSCLNDPYLSIYCTNAIGSVSVL